MEKIIDLARKLKALADRGIDGEKDNAAFQLDKLLKKYGLSIEDVQGERKTRRSFKYKYNDEVHKKFVLQVIASVVGKNVKLSQTKYSKKDYVIDWVVEITDAEYMEISEKIDFYWKAYKQEHEIFYSAFIQMNSLFLKQTQEEKDESSKDLTKEEQERIERMFSMMNGMKQHTLHKKIDKT